MKVLIVDDNAIILETEKCILENCQISAETAGSGAEAIRLVQQESFDAVLMDLHMPEMNGFQAAARIKSFCPALPVIALTADTVSALPGSPEAAVMDGFLTKPLQPRTLLKELGKYGVVEPDHTEPQPLGEQIFDREAMLRTLQDRETARRLVARFLEEHAGDCDRLAVYLNEGQWQQARAVLHDLVGLAGNLHCQKLCQAARQLGAECRRKSSAGFPEFRVIWDETIRAMETALQQDPAAAPEPEQSFSPEEIWDTFFTLCREFDTEAVVVFERNQELFRRLLEDLSFRQLREAVRRYDFPWIAAQEETFRKEAERYVSCASSGG